MKLLFAFCPFSAPTSPPLGLACVKSAMETAKPGVEVTTVDWNLAFFRRWLLDPPPHLCDEHPTHLLAKICPNLLVENAQGKEIWEALASVPEDPTSVDAYITAARLMDDIHRALLVFLDDLLTPFVQHHAPPVWTTLDRLFGAELAMIERERPDLLGFSILSERNLLYSLALARAAKQRFGSTTVLGGAVMSHLEPREILNAFPWIDFVFSGEAEASLVDFCDALDGSPGGFARVGGLAYRDRTARPVVEPPASPPDPTKLPFPDFSDFPLGDYLAPEPVLPLLTCRGCYWGKCAFCSHTLPFAPGVRLRPAVSVVDEIEHQMARHHVRRFLFVDEAMAPKTLRGVSEEILTRKLDIVWGAEGIRVERNFDEELLGTARRAGLRWVYVGVESSVRRLLDRIEKGVDPTTIEGFVAACRKVGIVAQLSFIIGIPGTTAEELEEEIRFMQRHAVDASSFVLLVGSPMQRRPEDFGIRIEDREVLFSTPTGNVHAPRFHFTSDNGLSPCVADEILRRSDADWRRPRMRPHLGEVHATVLAGTGFFDQTLRPPEPGAAAHRARESLTRDSERNVMATLHRLGCLEVIGDFSAALKTVRAALERTQTGRNGRRKLLVHLGALYNRAGRFDLARQALSQARHRKHVDPGIEAELTLACYRLGDCRQAIRHGEALLSTGHQVAGIHGVLSQCYEELGRFEEAIDALQEAESRDWNEPEINLAQARVLERLGRADEAENTRLMAARKQEFLCQGSCYSAVGPVSWETGG